MTQNKLPNKLWELLELALNDLKTVEQDSRYEVNMGEWHAQDVDTGKCMVCLAGSVITQQFNVNINEIIEPANFNTDIANKLHSLNSLRLGSIGIAIDEFGYSEEEIKQSELPFDVSIPSYFDDPEGFYSELTIVVELLKSKDL